MNAIGDVTSMSWSLPEREHSEFIAVTRSLADTVETGVFNDRL
jgi:hypothetical protein